MHARLSFSFYKSDVLTGSLYSGLKFAELEISTSVSRSSGSACSDSEYMCRNRLVDVTGTVFL
jgi:hypothetical protein